MDRVKKMTRKGKNNDCCSTFELFTNLSLHIVLFVIFLNYFGVPSVQKYLDKETIVISSEEQTNGIESPAITIVPIRNKGVGMSTGWKSIGQNVTPSTFEIFNHCQRTNFASIEACMKNDTIGRDDFLKSARFGKNKENSTSLLDEPSMWSEDMTTTFLGRHYTLN